MQVCSTDRLLVRRVLPSYIRLPIDCIGNGDNPLVRRCQLLRRVQRISRGAEVEDHSRVLAFSSVPRRKSRYAIASRFAMDLSLKQAESTI